MRIIDISRKPAIARRALGRAGAIGFFAAIFAATAVIPAGPERDTEIPAQERLTLVGLSVEPLTLFSRNDHEIPTTNQIREVPAERGNTDFRAVLGVRATSSQSATDFIRTIESGFSPLSFITVSGGDQTPKWGRARAIPSVDVLDSKIDPFNPDATRLRATGINADITATEWLSFSILALEGKHESVTANPVIPEWLNEATFALRANIATGSTDLSFGGIRKIGSMGDEEPAVFADFARPFARGKVYGEWESEWINAWKNAATVGFSFGLPWRDDRTIMCTAEFRYQGKNEYSRNMIYAEVNGNELADGFSATMSALAAPDADEIVLCSGISQHIGEQLRIWVKYDYLLNWSDSGVKPDFGTDTPYGYSMKIGLCAIL
jgi:hypothetical protein